MFQFITRDLNKLYSKCPTEVKKYFNKESFYVFALVIKDYKNADIEEKTIVDALKMCKIYPEKLEKMCFSVFNRILGQKLIFS